MSNSRTDSSPDLERDLNQTQWVIDKVRDRADYAQNLYAALCNNSFQKQEVWPVLRDQTWSCSWRYAGGIVANLRGQGGDYLDYYCSGMMQSHPDDDLGGADTTKGHVPEGLITDEVRADLERLGWIPVVDQ